MASANRFRTVADEKFPASREWRMMGLVDHHKLRWLRHMNETVQCKKEESYIISRLPVETVLWQITSHRLESVRVRGTTYNTKHEFEKRLFKNAHCIGLPKLIDNINFSPPIDLKIRTLRASNDTCQGKRSLFNRT